LLLSERGTLNQLCGQLDLGEILSVKVKQALQLGLCELKVPLGELFDLGLDGLLKAKHLVVSLCKVN
jgi:hypothetical protein